MKQLFYFSADWCVPCQTFGPIMDQVSQKIQVQKINVDYEPDVITKYGVRSVPIVILVENGQELRRFEGPRSLQQILNFIQ
jgi:putative thioredoxin